jgi:hypothetical protein
VGRGGKRVIWCGFDVRDSDLPLRVAFPIFVTNSLRWLSSPRGQSASEGASLRAGQPFPILAPQSAREITVTAPGGAKERILVRDDEPVLYDRAASIGVYQAQSGNWSQSFAVSLLNKGESDLTPQDALKFGNKGAVSGENRARTNRELWGYLVAIALLVLGVEWWVFHRGV